MIYENILEATGNTPLIRLNHMTGPEDAQILVKFEAMNAGGSIKTRTALNMIEAAEKKGLIQPGKTTIVEPTSGNQGIGHTRHHARLGERGEEKAGKALRGGGKADPRRRKYRKMY